MSIYITGDTHGTTYLKKVLPINMKDITKEDVIFITGDFGLVFRNSRLELEEKYLRVLDDIGCTFCFIDGDRDNILRLKSYPEEIWNGGKVRKIKNNILFMQRGEVYTIDNMKFLCIGGAKCYNTANLIRQKTWWKESEISIDDVNNALFNLKKNDMEVDYVISHTCPLSLFSEVVLDEISEMKTDDDSCKLLEILKAGFKFKHWFFGHFHLDKKISNDFTSVHLDKILIK